MRLVAATPKRRPETRRKGVRRIGPVIARQFVPTAARHWQFAQSRDRLDDGRLASPVLANEEGDR